MRRFQAFQDPTGRGASAPALFLRGLVYLAVVATTAVLLLRQAAGDFSEYVPATAVVSSVGDGLDPGADVKLRGVLVGTVDEVESAPGGSRHVIHLRLNPMHAAGIPASVKARIIPTNIFGQPSVDLVAERGDTTALAAGATIPGDESQEALQLQTAISSVQQLLTTVEPAKLNATLSSIRRALDGRGAQIGRMIDRLHSYVGELNPHREEFAALVSSAATSLEAVAETAPDLLDTVDDLLPTARTVVDKRAEFDATMRGAAALLGTVDGFLQDNQDRIIHVTSASRRIFAALSSDPDAVPGSFRALGKGVAALAKKFDKGTGHLDIGGTFLLAPYQPYTAADCPRYPGLDGPNCGQPVPRERKSSARDDVPQLGGAVGPVGSRQELQTLDDVLGDDTLGDNGIAGVLLGPLLRGSTVVMPR